MTFSRWVFAAVLLGSGFAHAFELSSADLEDGAAITDGYYWNQFGCSGGNQSPAISWKNAPPNTRSFAVTVYDKDAPTGSGFWHYIVYDLAPTTTGFRHSDLQLGLLPAGAKEGNTDLGKPGYFGPCPPVGRKHHYIWTVYALSVDKLPVDAQATPALIGFNLWQHTLAKASFTVTAGPRE